MIRWRTCPGEVLGLGVDPEEKNITIKEMKTDIKHRSSPEMEGLALLEAVKGPRKLPKKGVHQESESTTASAHLAPRMLIE